MRNAERGTASRWTVCLGTFMLCLLGSVAPLHAADDPVQKALKAYEKHRYEDAARELLAARPNLPSGKRSQAQLAFGMTYLRNAELHREFADLAAAVTVDYLQRLSAQRGAERSRYSDLYLGFAELEAGRPDRADAALGKFIAAAGDARARTAARIAQGVAAVRRGDRRKADELWSGIAAGDPEVRAALADAFSIAAMKDKDPPSLCAGALIDAQKSGKSPSIDLLKSCLGVFARAGMVDKGTDLLRRADLKAYSFRETLGKSKVLTFYDIRLQANLAAFYLEAGLAALKEAAADPQLRGIASYYLGEAHAMAGNSGEAATAMAAFLASSQTPAPYRNRAFVRQAEIQYRLGRRTEAMGRWEELARTHAKDPDLLADIVSACGRLRIDCPRPAEAAAAAAEAGEGKRFAALNIGLGAYHRGRKDTARALAFLEAGRDKGNKNKIEFNDPLMLTALADSYYRTKKFSESLEILFEMSKQFPQVRQIQESLQGIYSMEHKSAGDVKIN